MGITVRDALQLDCLRDAKVISGHGGLDNIIEYVDVIEMPNVDDWLKSNILMLSSFYAIRDDEVAQIKLIKNMAKAGVAGLILAPEFYLKKLNIDIVQLSNELNFPIIELPPEYGYADIIKPILGKIFKANLRIKDKDEIKDFIRRLLIGEYKNEKEVYTIADSMNIDLTEFGVVMAMKVDISSDAEKDVMFQLSLFENIISFKMYKNIVILPILHYDKINNKEALPKIHMDVAKEIKTHIDSKSYDITIGIGRYYDSILDISKSYEEAKKALVVSESMANKILLFDDLKIYKLITKVEDKEELDIFYKETLYQLEKYDEENNTDFVDTLRTYFDCNENMQVSSENLHVHINTMKYRISRIKSILGIEEFSTDKKVELYLALKIKEIF